MTSQIKRQQSEKIYKKHEKSVKQILLDIQNKMQLINNDNDEISNDTLKKLKINTNLNRNQFRKCQAVKEKGRCQI